MANEIRAVAGGRPEEFSEKSFYLDEFHEKTLFFALAPGSADESGLAEFTTTARELMRAEVRLVVLVADGDTARRIESRFRRLAAASLSEPLLVEEGGGGRAGLVVEAKDAEPGVGVLMRLWSLLRLGPIAVVWTPDRSWVAMADYAARLAARLKVHKLVLVDREGGVGKPERFSFMDESMLATLLGAGEAEWVGVAERRPLIEVIRDGLLRGIPSINLCPLEGLAHELYTYEGSGTLFTLEDYCRVEPLGIDDFREVELLLERGQREGFLKLRSAEEIAEILFTGYGATIGSGHLAGVGSLLCEPYGAERMGEVVALYTINRFKGEGVGGKLLGRILQDARDRRLAGVFACTSEERAGQFFLRNGFRVVTPAEVPAAKWREYDPERRSLVTVLRLDLE